MNTIHNTTPTNTVTAPDLHANPLVIAAQELLRSAGVNFMLYEGTGITLVRGGATVPVNHPQAGPTDDGSYHQMQALLDKVYPNSRLSPSEADEVLRELAKAGVVQEVNATPVALDADKAVSQVYEELSSERHVLHGINNALAAKHGVAITETDKYGAPKGSMGRHMKPYLTRLKNPKYTSQTIPFKGREFDWGQTQEMRDYFRMCLSARLNAVYGSGNYSTNKGPTAVRVVLHPAK